LAALLIAPRAWPEAGIEVLSVQRSVEAIVAHQVLEAIAWLDECQVHQVRQRARADFPSAPHCPRGRNRIGRAAVWQLGQVERRELNVELQRADQLPDLLHVRECLGALADAGAAEPAEVSDAGVDPCVLAQVRTNLADDRTTSASDRTLLDWYRTAFGAFALSLGFGAVLPSLSKTSPALGDLYVVLGICFSLLGA
jgi:hypothetical protein